MREQPTPDSPKPSHGETPAQSEGQLNLIINTIPAMAWSSTPDGMLDFCNQHFLDFVGLPATAIMGLGFQRIFHPDDMQHLLSVWQEIMASKCAREVDGRIRRADGQYRWFTLRQNPLLDAAGDVVKWYGVVLDIEDRKRAEAELREAESALLASERNLRLIIDSLPVLAWSARPDGSADFVNKSWTDYAGVAAEELLEWGFGRFYHPDDVDTMVATWKSQIAAGDRTSLTGRIRRHDGHYRRFLFSGRKITDANGVVRWFGVNVDIEDLHRAEEELRQSQADLARVTRMTTMGELAVSIAHEVNQPLTAIVTNAGTCMRWLDAAQLNVDLARQAAERIVRDGHRAGDIVASIRALARKSAPRMEPVDLRRLIQQVLDLLRGELQRRDTLLEAEQAARATMVLGDATQLQQVALNLIMNAIEAMAPVESGHRRLTVRIDRVGETVQLSVRDTGIGLGPDRRDRIFEAFYSTKPDGIGMGLAICRSIVEAHGGHIRAADNTPRGSVFTLTLPLIDEGIADG